MCFSAADLSKYIVGPWEGSWNFIRSTKWRRVHSETISSSWYVVYGPLLSFCLIMLSYGYLYNSKKEVTHKVTQKVIHPQSISKILHIFGIVSQVTSVNRIRKNKKKNETYKEIGSKCATFYIAKTRKE